MRTPLDILAAAAVLSTLALPAYAQTPSAESGVKLGDKSRLHAKLDLSTMYDTNAFRQNDTDDIDDNWRLLVRPGLWLDVPGTSFSFRARGDVTLTQFLDDIPAFAGSETRVGGSLGLDLRAGSDRSAIAFSLADRLTKTPVFLSEPETTAADEVRFPQWQNNGEAKLTARPGGRALELDFGYRNRIDIFTDSDEVGVDALPESHRHLGFFDVRWKFLPKTAAVFLSEFGLFVNERNPTIPDNATPEQIEALRRGNNDATPLSLQLGLVGQLTPRFITELRAGYGNALVWANDDVFGSVSEDSQDSPIGAALLTYRAADRISLTGGYERTVRPLILFDSVIEDSFLLRGSVGIDRFVGQLFGSFNLRNFGFQDRFAQVAIGGVSLDYYVLKFLVIGAQYRVTFQDSDDDEQPEDQLGTVANPFVGDFTRHQVVFTLGVTY